MRYYFNTRPEYNDFHAPPYAYLTKVFSDEEINLIEEIGEKEKKIKANIDSDENSVVNEKIRKSTISWIKQTYENLWIFQRIEDSIKYLNDRFYNYSLDSYSEIQYTCYDAKKSHYDWHTDIDYNSLSGSTRKLSVSILLSNIKDYEGGDFQYYKGGLRDHESITEQEKGNMIVFPSFLLHRVTPVTKGVRKSLVVWMEGPHFK
jgi:predicted 2-oxoglutarate/Fe(II)-dependent dioxygenase YbiX